MKVCPKCQSTHDKNGTFCSRKCANSRIWSDKDNQLKRESLINSPKFGLVLDALKISGAKGRQTMKDRGYTKIGIPHGQLKSKECPNCHIEFIKPNKKTKHCSISCAMTASKIRNSTPEARKRLRDIGRSGGFGKKGYTTGGTYYQSSLEKLCFEFLETHNILFEAHKQLPNSSKVSDCYFSDIDMWVEIDGINREKRKKWLEQEYKYWSDKMAQYKEKNLKLTVVTSFDEFKNLLGWRIG